MNSKLLVKIQNFDMFAVIYSGKIQDFASAKYCVQRVSKLAIFRRQPVLNLRL